jgi:hypothetical protein
VPTILPDEMPPRWLDQIRTMIQDSASETRRHFDVVAEGRDPTSRQWRKACDAE